MFFFSILSGFPHFRPTQNIRVVVGRKCILCQAQVLLLGRRPCSCRILPDVPLCSIILVPCGPPSKYWRLLLSLLLRPSVPPSMIGSLLGWCPPCGPAQVSAHESSSPIICLVMEADVATVVLALFLVLLLATDLRTECTDRTASAWRSTKITSCEVNTQNVDTKLHNNKRKTTSNKAEERAKKITEQRKASHNSEKIGIPCCRQGSPTESTTRIKNRKRTPLPVFPRIRTKLLHVANF